MNDEMIDLNLMNVLEKDYLMIFVDNDEDCMDEYLIKEIHV
jgi:hypothetical protein